MTSGYKQNRIILKNVSVEGDTSLVACFSTLGAAACINVLRIYRGRSLPLVQSSATRYTVAQLECNVLDISDVNASYPLKNTRARS